MTPLDRLTIILHQVGLANRACCVFTFLFAFLLFVFVFHTVRSLFPQLFLLVGGGRK